MTAGMSSICPLKEVTVFVLQLTRKGSPSVPSIYLPLSFDMSENSLRVFIPPRSEQAAKDSLPYLIVIDRQLKQFSEQFRAPGNHACVIAPAIKRLLSIPNLLIHH